MSPGELTRVLFFLWKEYCLCQVKFVGYDVDTLVLNNCYVDKQSFAKLYKVEVSKVYELSANGCRCLINL